MIHAVIHVQNHAAHSQFVRSLVLHKLAVQNLVILAATKPDHQRGDSFASLNLR